MIQIIKMTREEKIKMYMKSTKKELIEMLIEANRCLNVQQEFVVVQPEPISLEQSENITCINCSMPIFINGIIGNQLCNCCSTKYINQQVAPYTQHYQN